MSSIKARLRLYEDVAPREANIASRREVGASVLRFGNVRLEERAPQVFQRREVLENPSCGSRALRDFLPLSLTGIMELAVLSRQDIIHPAECLFLDTETTGLSRGAATLPFLTGVAYFSRERLILEQIFLNDPSGEDAYLEYISELLARYPYLVTYNGKSFDIPLIRNRLILNRRRYESPLIHFDLLHILRKLFPRGSVPGHKQGDLENVLLSQTRKDDFPGAEIPQTYFDYKRYGETSRMDRIFEHNSLDVQGLAFLFLEAIRVYVERDVSSPAVRSGLARLLAKNRRTEEAILALEGGAGKHEGGKSAGAKGDGEAKGNGEAEDETIPAEARERRRRLDGLFLAGLYRRRGLYERALELYREVYREHACRYACLSLAKILEHRTRDVQGALQATESLLDFQRNSPELSWRGAFSRERLAHRRNRLQKKLNARKTDA